MTITSALNLGMGMTEKHTYRVAMLGLPEIEQRVLRSIARISVNRSRSYEFVDIASDPQSPTDVVLVDGDSPQVVEHWRKQSHAEPAVFISSSEVSGERCVRRPIIGARLLVMLDEIVGKLSVGGAAGNPRADARAQASAASVSAMPPATGIEGVALVVDDSPTVRKHIEQGLSPFGLQVHFAASGEEAVECLARQTYDIVFLDVVLPGIDGYAVCKTIKKDRGMKSTPVIMLTGKSSTFDRIKGSLAGCDTYLTKPVDYQLFQDTVKKYLGVKLGVLPALNVG